MKRATLAASATGLVLLPTAIVTAGASEAEPTPTAAIVHDAQAKAEATGRPVEDEAQRTPTETVFANPDGTWTSHTSSEPVRSKGPDGEWRDIDLTLHKVEGGYAPASALGELKLSSGGDQDFASLSAEGETIGWKWPTDLPSPEIDGATATYRGVALDGTADLVVTATASGFRHDLVLNDRPSGPVTFPMPIALKGAKTTESSSGELTVAAADGQELVSAPTPLMYENGSHVNASSAVPVDAAVANNGDGSVLTLAPDTDFLMDPSTNYPVTIDPTWNSVNPDDTWVVDNYPTSIHPYDDTLHVGTPDSGATRYRSFIRFEAGAWDGNAVSSATLRLRNWRSLTCSGSAVEVRRTTTSWQPGSTTWNEQPSTTTSGAATSSVAKGYSDACPAGDSTWNVTATVSAWAGSTPNYGFRVAAVNEAATSGYRKYRSAGYETVDATLIPELSVTYTVLPGAPTDFHVKGGTTTALVAARPQGVSSTSTARMKVDVMSGTSTAAVFYSDYVTSGNLAYVPLPDLAPGTYSLRLWSESSGLSSSASTSAGSVTVTSADPVSPGPGLAWTPATTQVDTLNASTHDFAPATPAGYTLSQAANYAEVRDPQGVLVGSYWPVAIDVEQNLVPTSLAVQNGHMTVTVSPTSTSVLPIMTGTVFEEAP